MLENSRLKAVASELVPRDGRLFPQKQLEMDVDTSSRWPYEWMASLRTESDEHRCGGTLIAPSVVLSVAHCFDKFLARSFPVSVDLGRRKRVGPDDSGYQKYKIADVIAHEDFSIRNK